MKVAVCFSGHLRTFRECASSWQQVVFSRFSRNAPDVFLHTWGKLGVGDRFDETAGAIDTRSVMSQFDRIYKPVAVKLEEPIDFSRSHSWMLRWSFNHRNPLFVPSMFYAVEQADLLRQQQEKKQGWRYDVVVRARTDLLFSKFEWPGGTPSSGRHYTADVHNYCGLNDQFWFGDSADMTKSCALYSNLEKRVLEEGCMVHPETLMKFHVHRCGLSIVHVPSAYVLKRER